MSRKIRFFFSQYQGYDINIGGWGKGSPGQGGYFAPYNNPYLKDGPEEESLTDRLGDECVKILKQLWLYENTIIFFTSDNGGLSTSGGSPTSNLPLRAGKDHLYEGGIREPLIVTWKNSIQSDAVNETQIISIDYFLTILDLTGNPFPKKHKIDGISVKPALMEKKQNGGSIYWRYPHYPNQGSRPSGAILEGDYKLIEFFDTEEKELYNLKNDVGEKHKLT
jgi:arylsulfatase A-like enzyme